jgi:hypothetical protein
MKSPNNKVSRVAVGVLCIVTVVAMVLSFIFGAEALFKGIITCMTVLCAVSIARTNYKLWVVVLWTCIACLTALSYMGLSFTQLMEILK